LLSEEQRKFLISRHLYPEPRLGVMEALANEATAAMDISDGLALDLTRMCEASGISAKVSVPLIPLSAAGTTLVQSSQAFLDSVLAGGDDYEILAAVPPNRASAFESACRQAGVEVARIGAVFADTHPPEFQLADGSPLTLSSLGFEHFRV
jgi:thiamine-monophosphate kinase